MRLLTIVILLLIWKPLSAQPALLPKQKLAPPLRNQLMQRSDESQKWMLKVTDLTAFQQFLKENNLENTAYRVYSEANIIFLNTSFRVIYEKLLHSYLVVFIDRADRRPQLESAVSFFDISANKVNLVHSVYPQLNGKGQTVSVKEEDFDLEDIDFNGRILLSGAASGRLSTHATIMATIIGGGGNTFYSGKGVAWGTHLTSADFEFLIPENPKYYDTLNISVQNHSYGVGIENYYGLDAAVYDGSVIVRPELLHIFSSGNRGNASDTIGNYKNIETYANITGSFKMSKNSLSVGSMDSLGVVPTLSSKGPAYDGRIKPELVAFGLDGSSGAAAMVSGITLLLQEAYKILNNNENPPAALIKALLINSADDVGNPGIDFESGYGRANAWRAMQSIQQKQYYNGIITKDETLTLPINIPANAKNFKITLAWTDEPAEPNAEAALVNDLDIILYHAASQQNWLPWVLNHFPHPDSLSQLPTRKADHLNNVEQITLENPTPGRYDMEVNGFNITNNFQEFSLVFQFDTLNHFQWTFPAKNDNILAGEEAILRWETTLNGSNNKIEYSINNGQSWELIAENVDLAQGYFRWQSLKTFATAQLRLTHDNHIYLSEIFTLSQPLNLKVGFNCPDSTLLYWNKNLDVNNYIIYTLESEYLTPIITTNDTFMILYKNIYPSPYIAVAPVLSDSYNGMKSYAIQYENQGTTCYIRNFLADLIDDTALLELSLGTTYEVNNIVFEKLESGNYIPIATIPASDQPLFQFYDSNLKPGINTYRARVNLNNGAILYSESAGIYYEGQNGFYVFPNPVSQREELNILSKGTENLRFILYDALGRQILNQPLLANIENISLQKMAAGIYYYAILDGNSKIGQGKLVIRP